MAEVRLSNITKMFGMQTAVATMNLTITDGEFMVLVGPSGCGKTTTLRMIAGLEEPTEGDIYIGTRNVTYLEPKDRDIAMVFQNYALYPHMKVFDNLAYSMKLAGVAKQRIREQVDTAAALLGIANLLDRYPRELSGGQQQRVALGRAIVRQPQVFLMDEPLSNLDAKLRVQTRAELIKLHQQLKTTVVYVTHDQVEAMTMGTRIVVMKDGIVQQVGTPAEIYRQPANMFVGAFVGSPPMQFLRGELSGEQDDAFFKSEGFAIPLPVKGDITFDKRNVSLGFRPENLTFCIATENDWAIPCIVEVVENIGGEALVHARTTGGSPLIVKLTDLETIPTPGEQVKVRAAKGNLHLFDMASTLCVATVKVTA
ncbi:glycerol-3-phosphate ABC transporter ATP-binding protein [Anaerosporomusa subterranea]|uniref:Glycerol-3-phosphate ABC transporter ATP-binding protein n=1 Tax=Anaerosporomusa subterranea TaxID=1794912 RepID=A0A154BQ07_ANASB|nr:sn-glycerol-3-phosphate ABC transporter ATP-binding protein UgpC [Anaerosporomusa subterranea]KYZ75588.1 glycerol-3-phosphate ABC transporter ATP-binding protein [Anaerosporomusa subterranea]